MLRNGSTGDWIGTFEGHKVRPPRRPDRAAPSRAPLRRVRGLTPRPACPIDPKGAVWAARLNKPALLALTASADFTARVWDALTGDELHLFQHKHIVRTCHFTEDLTRVMTGGMEKIIRIYDLNRPEADPFCIHGSESGVRCGLFGMDDTVLFTALSGNSGVWYAPAGTPRPRPRPFRTRARARPAGRLTGPARQPLGSAHRLAD